MGLSRASLLNQAGYSEGDVLPVVALTPANDRQASTTNTSYQRLNILGRHKIQWDRIIPTGATAVVSISATHNPGTDETMQGRFQNISDSETVIETSQTSSFTNFQEAWGEYTPSTTGSTVVIEYQHKTSPGTNSSQTQDAILFIGIQL